MDRRPSFFRLCAGTGSDEEGLGGFPRGVWEGGECGELVLVG